VKVLRSYNFFNRLFFILELDTFFPSFRWEARVWISINQWPPFHRDNEFFFVSLDQYVSEHASPSSSIASLFRGRVMAPQLRNLFCGTDPVGVFESWCSPLFCLLHPYSLRVPTFFVPRWPLSVPPSVSRFEAGHFFREDPSLGARLGVSCFTAAPGRRGFAGTYPVLPSLVLWRAARRKGAIKFFDRHRKFWSLAERAQVP